MHMNTKNKLKSHEKIKLLKKSISSNLSYKFILTDNHMYYNQSPFTAGKAFASKF